MTQHDDSCCGATCWKLTCSVTCIVTAISFIISAMASFSEGIPTLGGGYLLATAFTLALGIFLYILYRQDTQTIHSRKEKQPQSSWRGGNRGYELLRDVEVPREQAQSKPPVAPNNTQPGPEQQPASVAQAPPPANPQPPTTVALFNEAFRSLPASKRL